MTASALCCSGFFTRHGLAAAALCTALAAASAPAHAVVAGNTSLGVAQAESLFGIDLDGVAKLQISGSGGSRGCSGTLLDGGAWVVTAAHCVSSSSSAVTASSIALSFAGGVTASVSSASQVHVFADWDGTLGQNDDIALLRLDAPVTTLSGFGLATGSYLLGSTVLITGFGESGQGATGAVSGSFGTLHVGTNNYDATYSGAGSSLMFDFDNGRRRQSFSGGFFPTTYEAGIAAGDSGGGSFMLTGDGTWVLAGVHSFEARLASTDIDGMLNGSFGELGADTTFGTNPALLAWMGTVTAVPEPSVAVLLAGGLAVLALGRRRASRPRR